MMTKTKCSVYIREVFRVTQKRDGCTYRTKSIGFIYCTSEYAEMLQIKSNASIIVARVN